jgi:hypothetical protein
VTEWDEPQAVIGSYLQRYAYPDYWRLHVEQNKRELKDWVRGKPSPRKLSGGEAHPRRTFRNIVQRHRRRGPLPAAARRIHVRRRRQGRLPRL